MSQLDEQVDFLLIEIAAGRMSVIDLRARLAQSDRDIASVGIEKASPDHLQDREAIRIALAEIDRRIAIINRNRFN